MQQPAAIHARATEAAGSDLDPAATGEVVIRDPETGRILYRILAYENAPITPAALRGEPHLRLVE